jgi:hypothetical protein
MYNTVASGTESGLALGNALGISQRQAENALVNLNETLGKLGGGFSIPNQYAYDTLPLFSFIREQYGIDTLLNNNKEVIKAAGGGTARQEHIGAAYFPKLFETGDAHRADFDVTVLNYMATKQLPELNGQTLLEYMNYSIGGKGLDGISVNSHTINTNQMYYIKSGSRDQKFAGKGQLNFSHNE